MQEPKPKDRTPEQHRDAMIEALETLRPIIAGAAHYEPHAFCEPHAGGWETLTELGRKFAGVVYHAAAEAHAAAEDAAGYLVPSEKLLAAANDVMGRMALCTLFALGLMDPELPPHINTGEAFRRIHKEAEAAYEALLKNEGRSRAVEPPVVATATTTRTSIDASSLWHELRRELRPLKVLSEQLDPLVWRADGCELSFELQEAMEDVSLAAGRALERLQAMSPPAPDEIQNEYLATLSTLAAVHLLGRHLGNPASSFHRLDTFDLFNIPERWYIDALIHLVAEMDTRTTIPGLADRWEELESEEVAQG